MVCYLNSIKLPSSFLIRSWTGKQFFNAPGTLWNHCTWSTTKCLNYMVCPPEFAVRLQLLHTSDTIVASRATTSMNATIRIFNSTIRVVVQHDSVFSILSGYPNQAQVSAYLLGEKKHKLTAVSCSSLIHLAPVVQRLDNAIHRINHYPADKC